MKQPAFRFAPSPNGALHLGHAFSALINHDMARAKGGRFLLRMEDIDTRRCTPELEAAMIRDLEWLGISWEKPIRRQSEHFDNYQAALDKLFQEGLVYRSFMTRTEIQSHIAEQEAKGRSWPRDPDGAPVYPGLEKRMTRRRLADREGKGQPYAWRIDMEQALQKVGKSLSRYESGAGPNGETGLIDSDPSCWGDVILARKETPASYHLSVTVDDALQGISHIVRGHDLFHATSIHRLLQELLGLPAPLYHHHRLILDKHGRKFSKSRNDTALAHMRENGITASQIRKMTGL